MNAVVARLARVSLACGASVLPVTVARVAVATDTARPVAAAVVARLARVSLACGASVLAVTVAGMVVATDTARPVSAAVVVRLARAVLACGASVLAVTVAAPATRITLSMLTTVYVFAWIVLLRTSREARGNKSAI
jgi:hypothetical protein